ncbi:SUKH-4 family immunity protein [Dyella sp. RRB7]|uniref:SUKH-4 family immunity protein n=1 Tax=Dyella sp. RRB7 TaxID=2919502 RepID=UPI001FAB08A3|nr:SUKH-4 family immunity protein [Dyella sp. RRB7]
MEPYQLMDAWREAGEKLVIFSSAVFEGLPVPSEAKAFLGEVGLPASAAPFLDFTPPKNGVLPTVAQIWRLDDADLLCYYVIGSNGSGDSIAVSPAGAVYYLNHDAGFRPCYINRDVWTMSEVLLCYRQLVEAALAAGGPDGFLDGAVTPESTVALRRLLEARDPQALAEGSMWAEELGALGG